MAVCISIVLLEAYLRIQNNFPLQEQESHWLKQEISDRFRQAGDIMLGYEYIPNKKYTTWSKVYDTSNSFGFMDIERKITRNKNTYRICIVGDSITVDGRYVKYLEDLMNDADPGYEVWNCGVSAYNVVQYYANIKNKIVNYDPDMIIIGFCLNDFMNTPLIHKKNDGKFYVYDNDLNSLDQAINIRYFIKYRIYRFWVLYISKFLTKETSISDYNDMDIGSWALSRIADICRQKDIELFAVVIPYFKSEYSKSEKRLYENMKHVLSINNLNYLDLHGKFSDPGQPKWRREKNDFIHPSDEGHRIIGESLFDYLKEHTAEYEKSR